MSRVGLPSTMKVKPARNDSSLPMALDHCPLCVMHADALGLLPSNPATLGLNALSDALPSLFLRSPSTLHVWAAPLARAPPAALA